MKILTNRIQAIKWLRMRSRNKESERKNKIKRLRKIKKKSEIKRLRKIKK